MAISDARRQMMEKEKAAANSNSSFYQTKNLTTDKIRLTPLNDDEPVGHKVTSYFINKKRIVCPEETSLHGTPGRIAKARRALQRIGTPKALEFAETLYKARRSKYVMKIISRTNPGKVQWFEAPKAVYQVALDAGLNDGEDISHPKTGRDIRITKTGSGMQTEYNCRLLDISPLADTKEERLRIKAEANEKFKIEELTKLDEEGALEALKTVIPKDLWAQISKEVLGDAADDEDDTQTASDVDDEDEDEAPAKKTTKATVVDDEDDEDEEPKKAAKPAAKVVDEEDDEDEEPVKAKPKAGKGVTVEDDEDEPAPAKKKHVVEDDEDDDMDDEPVVAKKGTKPAPVDDEDDE